MTTIIKNLNKSALLVIAVAFLPLLTKAQRVRAGRPQTDTVQHTNAASKNSAVQQHKPYVILISADGFRYDYAERYHADHILELSSKGVQAASMIPSFPSVTFPNHYTLVTGLYPSHHGLVNNSFYDPKQNDKYSMGAKDKVRDGKWYGGTPLWVLAEQQQMISASMFWVGSEAAIKGVRPTYYYDYTEQIKVARRIEIVKEWLSLPEEKRPHLITFYLSEPDHAGHSYGPEAPQTEKAVKTVDSTIYLLTEAVKATGLPVNFIFVADHGMTSVDRDHPIATPEAVDTAKFIIPSSGTMMVLHAKDKKDIMPAYKKLKASEKDYKVYLKEEMPEHFHYGAKDDRMGRIGDILLIPEWPKVFSDRKPGAGHHGFDPSVVKDMHASFYAWGPAFKSNMKIPSFSNVNVFPLITEILGLTYTEKIDGKKEVLHGILK
jgi:predicted AlkP superfamily pyrophosphatase or phosphodiesterase